MPKKEFKSNLEMIRSLDLESKRTIEKVLGVYGHTEEEMAALITEESIRFEEEFPYIAYAMKSWISGSKDLQANQVELYKMFLEVTEPLEEATERTPSKKDLN